MFEPNKMSEKKSSTKNNQSNGVRCLLITPALAERYDERAVLAPPNVVSLRE